MKPKWMPLVLASVFLASWYGAPLAAAQEPDLVSAVKKATEALAAADKVVVGARNALQGARNSLDVKRFNSAAYSANVSAQQVAATKDKYEKAGPKEKEDTLEVYELAQELAEQRKTALQAAEKVLPQKEAEAKAAEEKYATALAAAETLAGQIKALVRQTQSDALAKLEDSKNATERAAFAKATAEQTAAVNAQILKTMAELVAADKVLQPAAAALKQASDKDRPQKLAEVEAATKAYATALHAAARHLAVSKADGAEAVVLELRVPLVEADKVVQKSSAALAQAKQDLQNRTNAVKQAGERVKAAQDGVEKRIAKTRARKDLLREQAAAKRAEAAKLAAEQALPPITAEAEKTQKQYAAVLQAAVNALNLSPEAEKSVAAEKAAAAKTAAAKTVADKAAADKTPADKALADKTAGASKAVTALADAEKAVAAAKVAADNGIAEKAAAEKAVAEKTAAAQAAADAVVAQTDPAQKKTAEEAAATAAAEKAAAEKALAEKVAVAGKVAAAQTAAQQAQASAKAAAEKGVAEKAAAEKLVAEKDAVVQKATADLAAANKAADDAKTAAQSVAAERAATAKAAAEKAAIAKAMVDKEAEIKKENEVLAREAAEAQVAADKAQAAVVAVDKLAAERVAVREALKQIQRQRFFRDVSVAHHELRQSEAALASANKELQPKIAALNKAAAALKPAKDVAAKAQKDAAAQAALLASATKEKEAAEKSAKEKESAAQAAAEKVKEAQQAAAAAKAALEKTLAALKAAQKGADDTAKAAKDAEQKAAAAQAAIDKATAEKNTAEQVVNQRQQAVAAAPAIVAIAKAAAYGGLKPLPDSAWNYATARHLLVRAGFGGTPDEVAKLHAMGLHRAVGHFVNFTNQPPADIAFAAYPKQRPEKYEAVLSGEEQRRLRNLRVAKDRQQIRNMRIWWLRRMIESPRPLEEKLTLFWHGHFASQYSDVGDSYYMYLQNELFRDNAAGNFATLLHGIAHDGAMLKYLNNDTNVKGQANENLAREIMELFGMGRDQGYSETDIRQGARALTGYSYDPSTGQFRFISERHDTEPKTIFGKKGNWSGDDYARLILETPHPAKFIARQLFMFFAHDQPSIDTVEALATVMRLNNYDLAPVLENLFLSEEFYSARAMSTQVKSPVQLVVGLHRDLGLTNPDYAYLASALPSMGQDLFEPPSVFGWQTGRSWITTSRILGRYNVLAEIVEKKPRGGKTGVDVVGSVLAGKKFENHAEVVDYLVKCSWNVPLSESKRQALIEFLKPLPEPAQWEADPSPVNARLTHLLVMLMCSPEYQLN